VLPGRPSGARIRARPAVRRAEERATVRWSCRQRLSSASRSARGRCPAATGKPLRAEIPGRPGTAAPVALGYRARTLSSSRNDDPKGPAMPYARRVSALLAATAAAAATTAVAVLSRVSDTPRRVFTSLAAWGPCRSAADRQSTRSCWPRSRSCSPRSGPWPAESLAGFLEQAYARAHGRSPRARRAGKRAAALDRR
jgi:hypothetical protein